MGEGIMNWKDILKYKPPSDWAGPTSKDHIDYATSGIAANLKHNTRNAGEETNWKDKLTPQVQAKIEADKKRFGETMASIPRKELNIKRPPATGPSIKQEILDREQKKLDEAFAEKQRELQTQRSSVANAQLDRVAQKLAEARQKLEALMVQIKQANEQKYQNLAEALDRLGAEQKFQDIKNKLKESGLTNELAQVEAVENMVEG